MSAVRCDDNMTNTFLHQHIAVLLNEAIDQLVTTPRGVYVDATFGRGGHTRALLNKLNAAGRVIAFDKDLEAVCYANTHIQDPRFTIFHRSYAHLSSVLATLQLTGGVDGILFDLGVSSPQLEESERGFSFVREGKLDMRMDQSQGQTAMAWLSTVEEAELATVLWQYGEERYARRIAKAIIMARNHAPIETTTALAEIIKKAMPAFSKKTSHKHPATRCFQAIRIAINQELVELEQGLAQALAMLKKGGRLAVISFHSLEDRMVKQFVTLHEKGIALPFKLPVKPQAFSHLQQLKKIGKPIKPSDKEILLNPSARSAILRIAEKVS